MKGEKDRVERLLEKNAAEQLAKVDWDRLTDEISTRLDRAPRARAMPSRGPLIFRIAAGVAAAAVIFLAVMFRIYESPDKQGAGSIQIKGANGKILATFQDGRAGGGAAKCDVEIIDRKGDLEVDSCRAAWIIISAPTLTLADDGYNEEADLICLL